MKALAALGHNTHGLPKDLVSFVISCPFYLAPVPRHDHPRVVIYETEG